MARRSDGCHGRVVRDEPSPVRSAVTLYSNPDPARRVGAGLWDIDAGLRLQYEIAWKCAPYVGLSMLDAPARPRDWRGRKARARRPCGSCSAPVRGS